jgi:hypothetical protein
MSKAIMFSRAADLKGYVHYNVRCYFAEDVERLVEFVKSIISDKTGKVSPIIQEKGKQILRGLNE